MTTTRTVRPEAWDRSTPFMQGARAGLDGEPREANPDHGASGPQSADSLEWDRGYRVGSAARDAAILAICE